MSNGRLYVEGASRSLDDLAKTYEKIENVPAWAARVSEDSERPTNDPFGMRKKKKGELADPYEDGKEAAMRLTKFVALCASELELAPEQTIFAVELTALNVLNAEDCPISQEQRQRVREAAFKYYAQAVPRLP
jgi:hypothetical protein